MFPARKDIQEADLRSNLFTVRSCDIHNQNKSSDDEFLMASLAPVIGNNAIGYIHTNTKVRRAIERREGSLSAAAYREMESFSHTTYDGTTFPLAMVRTDTKRLLRALEAVARGIFRLEYDRRFIGECTVLPDFLTYDESPEVESLKQVVRLIAEQEASNWPQLGTNADVFYYQAGSVDSMGLLR